MSSFWKVIWALLNNIGGMIAVFLFLNNYFGAALLVLAGAGIIVQGKFFNDFGWLSGMTAKVFGLTWFVAGGALVVINTIQQWSHSPAVPLLGTIRPFPMTALYLAVFIWGLVAFMATDKRCIKHEKSAFNFLMLIGVILSVIGFFTFESNQLSELSISDIAALLLFGSVCFRLKIMSKLVQIQSEYSGQSCTFADLNLSVISDAPLIRKYKRANLTMWALAITFLVLKVWSNK